jgi:cbb3-type cytochrome oxidase maturation protein
VWILFVCSIIVLPGIALLAFRWALRHGEFDNLQKTALSIFDEEEPVGRVTDHFPGKGSRSDGKVAPPNQLSRTTGHRVPANSANAKL